jgi:hypothetical protein
MASYTAAQMYGPGVLGENFTSGIQKTFTFTNPGDSSYFTLETIRDQNGTFTNKSACAEGTWVVSSSMGFVYSPFISSVVVQPGVSSLKFTPSSNVTGVNYNLRGTGQFSLVIT